MCIFFSKNIGSLMILTVATVIVVSISQTRLISAFTIPQPTAATGYSMQRRRTSKNGFLIETLSMVNLDVNEGTSNNQVVELVDNDDDITSRETKLTEDVAAPFLSQGEISEEAMEMNWNDPKQTRVIFYIILSLLPVLFLVPLMLGSRDLIPPEALPPVELN